MGLVTAVNEWTNPQTGRKQWYVDVDAIPHVCYSAAAGALVVGQALPEGWTAEPAKQEGWKPRLIAPGSAQGGGGGGGGGFRGQPSWRNTEDGERYVERCMNRRTALMQAVAFVSSGSLADVLTTADVFDGWLERAGSPGPVAAAVAPPAAPAPIAPSPVAIAAAAPAPVAAQAELAAS